MAGAWAQDADRARYLYDHPHMWGGWGGSGMFFGPLMGILYLAVIIGVIVVGVRWLGGGSWPGTGRGAARHILEERFARGEIDAEELEEKRRILSG
jgi:putative membrane protein